MNDIHNEKVVHQPNALFYSEDYPKKKLKMLLKKFRSGWDEGKKR